LLYTFTALTFLKSIHKASHKQALQRQEGWELPPRVLREALVNMLVHRDYRQDIKAPSRSGRRLLPSIIGTIIGPTITIAVYINCIPHDRVINCWRIFYLMGLFENWGGTLKICRECPGSKEPWTYEDGMFRLVLFRR
jgi:ATP-dependent DNA helicase RecG